MTKPTDEPWIRNRVADLQAIAAQLPDIETTIDEYPGHGYPPTLNFPQFDNEKWSFYVAADIDSDRAVEPIGDIVAVGVDEFIPVDLSNPKATAAQIRTFIASQQES